MKTWHVIALGVAAVAVARAVNNYRSSHYQDDAGGRRQLSWAEGLLAVVGVYHFPGVINPPGGTASMLMLPTPQPSAGLSGLG